MKGFFNFIKKRKLYEKATISPCKNFCSNIFDSAIKYHGLDNYWRLNVFRFKAAIFISKTFRNFAR